MREDTKISPDTDGEKGKRKKWISILLAVLLLTAGILFVLYKMGCIGPKDPLSEAGIIIGAGVKAGDLEEGGGTETEEGSNGKAAMSLSINGRPVFADGGSEGNLGIVNPKNNMLYLNVEITLKNTGEVIYESGAIPPGHYIDNDKLTKVLEQGEYEATAYATLYDPDAPDTQFNSANFDLLITIVN